MPSKRSSLSPSPRPSISPALWTSMNALEILRETIRMLRHHHGPFLTVLFLLVCPVSAALLLSDSILPSKFTLALSVRFVRIASTSGVPLSRFVRQLCGYLAGFILSSAFCFPLLITFLLLAKSSVSYCVASVYASKQILPSEILAVVRSIWWRVVVTYLCGCALIASSVVVFVLLLIAVCSSLSTIGYPPEVVLYPAFFTVLAFSIAYAHVIIVCNLASVISVLEEMSGFEALRRSVHLIKGQTQAGLLIFLGSTIGFAFVEGLFEHRVKTLSYGDGSSRIWEGPLLVLMHSFVVLVDSMMNAVFYFTCRSWNTRIETNDLDYDSKTMSSSVEVCSE